MNTKTPLPKRSLRLTGGGSQCLVVILVTLSSNEEGLSKSQFHILIRGLNWTTGAGDAPNDGALASHTYNQLQKINMHPQTSEGCTLHNTHNLLQAHPKLCKLVKSTGSATSIYISRRHLTKYLNRELLHNKRLINCLTIYSSDIFLSFVLWRICNINWKVHWKEMLTSNMG